MADAWEGLGPCSFQMDGGERKIKFLCVQQDVSGGLRKPERSRPFRPGAKQDSTGPDPDDIQLRCPFFNTIKEPGVGADVGEQLWPDLLDEFEAILKKGKTGTLDLPWRRGVRVKGYKWKRSANANERGGEWLDLTLAEDNEDRVDDQALATVSVQASVLVIAEEATFDMDKEGMFDGSLEDLTELADGVEAAINAPGEFLDDIKAKSDRLGRTARSLRDSFSRLTPGRDKCTQPEGNRAERKLVELEDLAARASAAAERSLPKIITRTFDTNRDIFQIATELKQNSRDLININGQIEDLGFIPAGTAVRVFA